MKNDFEKFLKIILKQFAEITPNDGFQYSNPNECFTPPPNSVPEFPGLPAEFAAARVAKLKSWKILGNPRKSGEILQI